MKNVKYFKYVQKVVIAILIFLMTFSILYSTILCVIMRYASKENMLSKLEEIKIYKQVYNEIESDFENYIYQSGLEIDALNEICDEAKVKKDFLAIIDYIYEDKEIKIDSDDIINKLDKKINQYVEGMGKTLTTDEQANIKEFEIIVANSYGNNLSKYIELAKQIKTEELKNTFKGLILKRNISVLATIILAVLIVIINKKKIFSGVGYIGSIILSSGIILMLARFVIYNKIKIDGIVLFTKIISNITIYVVKEILSLINSIGAWYIGIGIFIILMASILGMDNENTKNEDNKKPENQVKEEQNIENDNKRKKVKKDKKKKSKRAK